jgi:PKD repeat protein/fibronectin type 3 domain-containing protein
MTLSNLLDIVPCAQRNHRLRPTTRRTSQRRRQLMLELLESRRLLHGGYGMDAPLTFLDEGQDLLIDVQLAARLAPSASDAASSLPESIAEVAADATFYVEVWVQDVGSNVGVTGGSVDLSYTTTTADAVALFHGSAFPLFTSGTINDPAGLVTDFGGGTLAGGLGVAPNWARLGYVQYHAAAEQPILFALAPGTLQFSLSTKGNVPAEQINFGTLALNSSQVNDPPVLSDVPEAVTIPELAEYAFNATATDPDLPAQTLTFSLIDAPTGAAIDSESGEFTWTPTEAQGPGEFAFTVRVTDDGTPPLYGEQAITITVTEVNDNPPVANPDAIALDRGETATILVGGASSLLENDTDADLPNDVLTVNTTPVSGPAHGTLVLNQNGTFQYTHGGSENLSDSFVYEISDAADATATATVTITVYDNRPFASLTADPNPSACNDPVTFDASGSTHGRPDRAIVQYEWDFDGDGTYDFTSDNPTTTHAYPAFGTYTAALRVTDNNVPAKTDTATRVVVVDQGNQPPVAIPGGPYNVMEGSGVTLDARGSTDPNAGCGDTIVEWKWDLDNDGEFDDGAGEQLELTPQAMRSLGLGDGPVERTIRLRVTDSFGATGEAETEIRVANVLPSNVEVNLSSTTINEGGSVTLDGTFVDPGTLDTHVVTVYWGDGASSTVELDAGEYAFSATHTYLDNATGTAASDFWISVSVIDKDFLPPVSGPPGASNFQFGQLNWYDAGGTLVVPNSSWGTFTADVVGDPDQVVYLNVAAKADGDTVWIVQNMPIFADLTNAGADFDISLLDVQPGMALAALDFVFTVDNSIRTTMPFGTMTTATVAAFEYHPCGDAELGQPSVPTDVGRPAGIRIDTEITDEIQHPGVPGVQEGVNQCLAGATARSIAWLNTRYNLGSPKSAQQIYDDIKALNTGSYADRLAGIAGYLSDLAAASGATASTKVLTAPGINVGNPAGVTLVTGQDMKEWIRGELQRGEDVTLDYDTHIVTVTGTFDAGDKTFLKYRDDENQRTNAFGDAGTKMGELSQDGDGNWQFRPAGSNSFFKVRLAMSESVYKAKVTVHNLPPAIVTVTNSGPVDAGSPVGVTITASDPAGANDDPLTYEWDWNNDGTYDESSVSTNVASYTYPDDGTYTVGVRVTDHDGAWAISNTVVTVYDNQPYARFTADPNPSACNDPVTFDASDSTHGRPDRAIVQYEWDFDGDGTFDFASSNPMTTHAYPAFGTYTATLRVTDDNDPPKHADSFFDVFVTLDNLPPVAVPGGPYWIYEGSGLTLDGSGSTDPNDACGDSIVKYEWDLDGDDTYDFTETDAMLTLLWTELAGLPTNTSLNVVLRVTDSFGLTHTDTTTLYIAANRAPTDIALSSASVLDLTFGAVVGNVTVTDPDVGDTHGFTVSDDRFEVTNGMLKLKSDKVLDWGLEPTVTLDITATDAGGLSITETFTIEVLRTERETEWRFDFNTPGSPTQAPVPADHPSGVYTGVLPTDVFATGSGYGWVTAPNGFDRGALAGSAHSALVRDGAWGSGPRDFRMRVEPELVYDVTVTFGDASFARDRMNVSVVTGGGGAGLSNVATGAGQFVHRSFTATPSELGDLVLQFSDGGGDPYWTVNAVEVRPVVSPFTVIAPSANPLAADGTTGDTFTVTGATAGAWYTVSTDMGRITTADGDSRYAGVQVLATGTSFSFTVERGTSAGTANVRVEEVNGASWGTATQAYVYADLRRFDFNGSGVDTESGFWNVRGSDVYTAAVGHGWNAAVGEFQRGPDGISEPQLAALYRDGHWQSAPRTFQVGVDSNKTYDVRIHTGDSSFARNRLRVTVEGTATDPSEVATAANEFKTILVEGVTVNDGMLDIQIANLGGDPYWVINGIEVAESGKLPDLPEPEAPPTSLATRFDFGTSSSPVDSAFTQVGATNAFDPVLGYGWTTAAPVFSRSGPTALLQDGHWGTDNTFLVIVNPSGQYIVNVTVGDASFARNNIRVDVNGVEKISNLTTAAGQFAHASTGTVSPNENGQLAIRVRSMGGDPYFTINALEILPAPVPPAGVHTLSTSDGGITIDGSGATAGALITVTTTLGTITGPDQSTPYAGHQVAADGSGNFSFTVTPPGGGGLATFTTEEVTGKSRGSTTQTYAVPAVRRFDFNGSGDALQDGFTGVRGNNLYNANNGFGWTQSVPEFQRGETGYSVNPDNVPLYRDGHWGSAARTFQVAVDPTETYDVRVYVGDRSFARNLIRVTVEAAPPTFEDNPNSPRVIPSTTANGFVAVTIVGGQAADGVLDVTIVNTGGDPYWVINGLDVWKRDPDDPSLHEPGVANLLAATWSSEMVGHRLTEAAVAAVLPVAREYWVSTGLADWQMAQLYQTPIAIGDLSYRGRWAWPGRKASGWTPAARDWAGTLPF